MSREIELILPSTLDIGELRKMLEASYVLNPRVPGLGELEQIDVQDSDHCYVATIEWHGPPIEHSWLQHILQERLVNPDTMRYFSVKASNWPLTNQMLLHVVDRDGAWLYAPDYSLLFMGEEYASRVNADPSWDYWLDQKSAGR